MLDWVFKINYLPVLFVFSLIIQSVMVDWAFKINYISVLFVSLRPDNFIRHG